MITTLLDHEAAIKLGGFFTLLLALWLAEYVWPKRINQNYVARKWINLALGVTNTVVLRLCFPILAVQFAQAVAVKQIGMLNLISNGTVLNTGFTVVIAMIALDLIIYWQHRLFHRLPWAWRLHRVHHSDIEFDVTTAIRFHPIEILLSMLIKMISISLLGAPALAVLLFESMLSLGALFTHANIRLPTTVDNALRWLVVTPDMHRIHHSVLPLETNSNYGFNLVIWDKLFRSYSDQPTQAHETMPIGLAIYRQPSQLSFAKLLTIPFKK